MIPANDISPITIPIFSSTSPIFLIPSRSSFKSTPPKSKASTRSCNPFIHNNASAANAVTTGIITATTTAILKRGTNIDAAPALIADKPPADASISAPAAAALGPIAPILLASSTISSVSSTIFPTSFAPDTPPINPEISVVSPTTFAVDAASSAARNLCNQSVAILILSLTALKPSLIPRIPCAVSAAKVIP